MGSYLVHKEMECALRMFHQKSIVTSPQAAVGQVRHGQIHPDETAPAAQPVLTEKAVSGEKAHQIIQEEHRIFEGLQHTKAFRKWWACSGYRRGGVEVRLSCAIGRLGDSATARQAAQMLHEPGG